MGEEIRKARAEDVPPILDVMVSAFRLEQDPERRRTIEHLVRSDWRRFLVLARAGKVVAAAHIRPDRLQVGRALVLKGDLGHVGVLRELHGRGLGTALVRACVDWMRDHQYHLSRLGGLMLFYRRFGYEPFLRRFLIIPVAPANTAIKGCSWAELYSPAPELAGRVRPYAPARDHRARHGLVQRFYAGRAGALLPAAEPGPVPDSAAVPNRFQFAYEVGGELLGVIDAEPTSPPLDLAPAGTRCFFLREFVFAPEHPEAVEALFKRLMSTIAAQGGGLIASRLPYDPVLFQHLTRAGIAFNLVEMHQAVDGNMIQVLALREIFRAIAPELEARLQAAGTPPWEGVVQFELPGQSAALRIRRTGLTLVEPAQPPAAIVRTDQATFVQWLFGIAGFAEFARAGLAMSPACRRALEILFPRLPAASGPWG